MDVRPSHVMVHLSACGEGLGEGRVGVLMGCGGGHNEVQCREEKGIMQPIKVWPAFTRGVKQRVCG